MNPYSKTMIRVRYQETDQMKFVYHSNYIIWFDVGRTEWLRELGAAYRELENSGLILPVTKISCRYRKPALYDDVCEIQTALNAFSGVKCSFLYRVIRQSTNELLAEGMSENAFINPEGRPIRLNKVKPDLASKIAQRVAAQPWQDPLA